jgi:hypothetical protein
MKNNTSINVFLGLIVLAILFHLLIIVKIIPYEIAWDGRLQDDSKVLS